MANITLRQSTGNTEPRLSGVTVKASPLTNIELDNNFNNLNNDINSRVSKSSAEITGNANVAGTLRVSSNTYLSNTYTNTITANSGIINGDVLITGNVSVQGTSTIINTEDVYVKDKNIVLANVATPNDATTANGGGITIKGSTDKTWNWISSTNSWTSSENINIISLKTYKINGVDVLSNTTLGASVYYSNLKTVGVLNSLSVVGNTTIGTSSNTFIIDSGNTVLSSGTADGILYLNSSKSISTNTNLTFNPSTGLVVTNGNISVIGNISANSINIDNTKYTANIGDGVNTVYSINHNMNKNNIISIVLENASGNVVYPDIVYINSNVIQVSFVSAPSSNQYSINLIGL